MKLATKDSRNYTYISKLKINIDFKNYNAEFGLSETKLEQFNEIVKNFIGNNQEEVISVFKPAIEEVVVKRILSLSNDIVKHFTFEELFPDRI